MTLYSSGYTCSYCGKWCGTFEQHLCNGGYIWPKSTSTYIIPDPNKKLISDFSLEELLNELKRRKDLQTEKVKELEKEVELQKKLDKMFDE